MIFEFIALEQSPSKKFWKDCLQIDLGKGLFIGHPNYQELTKILTDLADAYQLLWKRL